MNINIKKLYGSWKLNDFVIKKSDQTKSWRDGSHGILIYSPDGYMSVSINAKTKPEEPVDGLLFYSGTYKVEDDLVIHNVTNATSYDRIGQNMIRTAVLENNTLQLIAKGNFGTATLIWEKL